MKYKNYDDNVKIVCDCALFYNIKIDIDVISNLSNFFIINFINLKDFDFDKRISLFIFILFTNKKIDDKKNENDKNAFY